MIPATPPAALPKPLPPVNTAPDQLGNPSLWKDTKIVRFSYDVTAPAKDGKPATTTKTVFEYEPSVAYRNGAAHKPLSETPLAYGSHRNDPANIFTKVGTDFSDAVRAANALAKSVTDMHGRQADTVQSVLQSTDGEYYITALSRMATSAYQLAEFQPASSGGTTVRLTDVKPLIPAVKAVVDQNEWIDFSNSGQTINLS